MRKELRDKGRRTVVRLLTVALAALGATGVGASTPAEAAEYGPFTLTDFSQTASWSGALQAGPPVLPEACSPDVCDIVTVNVDLPKGVWAQPGGMLVATQQPVQDKWNNTFDLFVYRDGLQVAKSDSLWSAGDQAAWVEMTEENPANGVYTVVVAPHFIGDPPARYHGLVSFDRGLTVKRQERRDGQEYTQQFVAFGETSPTPAKELKPDLVTTPPENFHIETGVCFTFYACQLTEPPQQPSCYPEETAGLTAQPPTPGVGPQRCLRFDLGEYNLGDGPLELHIYPDKGTDAYQRVYRTDGSVRHKLVGPSEFHPAHGHFHLTGNGGWWEIKLREWLPNGQLGDVVEQAKFPNKGICPIDTTNGRFGQKGDSPLAYGNHDVEPSSCTTPRQLDPNHPDPAFRTSPYIQMGVSVGWQDEYPWIMIDQYIDITNVADGKYVIVVTTDPGGAFIEKTTANNTAMACVEIGGLGTTARACDLPDLQVTGLSASNTKGVREGEKVTITATVSNTGDGAAAASSTEFSLDGSRMPGGVLTTPGLAPGESATLSLNWDTRGVKGEHTITATADSGRTVVESSEDNNTREITVVVRGNKIRNPSFEESSNSSSPDDWSGSGPTGYESGGSDGARSVSTEPGGSWTSQAVPIEAGSSYDAAVATAGAGGTLIVQQLAADGSVLSSAAQPFLPTNAFTLTSLQLTALPGAAQARVLLVGGLTGTTTFDDVGLFGG